MVSSNYIRAVVALASCSGALAQTFSDCNPLEKDNCPKDPAFGGVQEFKFGDASSYDDLKKFWHLDGGVEFGDPKTVVLDKNGAQFVISKDGQNPTIISLGYLFFGKVEVEMQAAPGKGIVTALTLQSDDMDEIDFEWVGSHNDQVESNYYHIDQNNHKNAKTLQLDFNPEASTHTYGIDWTPSYITWSIDGKVIRTATPDQSLNGNGEKSSAVWPQTPMQIRIGTWCGGGAGFDKAPGTQEWAGGKIDWSQAPFTGVFKGVKVTDYGGGNSGAKEYEYSGKTGLWTDIKVNGGEKSSMPNAPGQAVVQAPNGSSSTSSSVLPPPAPTVAPSGTPPKPFGNGTGASNSTTTSSGDSATNTGAGGSSGAGSSASPRPSTTQNNGAGVIAANIVALAGAMAAVFAFLS